MNTAYMRFLELGNYQDSAKRAEQCYKAIVKEKYKRSVDEYNRIEQSNDRRTKLMDLYLAFTSIADYKDSKQYAKLCQTGYMKVDVRKNAYKIGRIVFFLSYAYLVVTLIIGMFVKSLSPWVSLIPFVILMSLSLPLVKKVDNATNVITTCLFIGTAVFALLCQTFSPNPYISSDWGGMKPVFFLERIICPIFIWLVASAVSLPVTFVLCLISEKVSKAVLGAGPEYKCGLFPESKR